MNNFIIFFVTFFMVFPIFFKNVCANENSTIDLINNKKIRCNSINHDIVLKPGQVLIKKNKQKYSIIELSDNEDIIRYYFCSKDIVDIPAYSGKPIETMIGINKLGTIEDVRLINHSEPILLIGIPEKLLLDSFLFYQGKNIKDNLTIGMSKNNNLGANIISGATVTSLVLHKTILESSRIVGKDINIIKQQINDISKAGNKFKTLNWDQLLKMGGIQRLSVYEDKLPSEVGETLWADIYFANVLHPSIGINLLGKQKYNNLLNLLKDGENAIMIINNGKWSFKGSGFVRGGIFDRFHIEQNMNIFFFRDLDYVHLDKINLPHIPNFKESGIFIIRDNLFNAVLPWNLVIIKKSGKLANEFKNFSKKYVLPNEFFEKIDSVYSQIWINNIFQILGFLILWAIITGIFIFRNNVSQNIVFTEKIHVLCLFFFIIITITLGCGQISIVNIFTLIDVIVENSSFKLFFLNPFIALEWIFVVISLLIYGRMFFCGWVCPFGALQHMLFNLRLFFISYKKRYEINFCTKILLNNMRYIVFILIFIVSFFSLNIAEILSEIEPFKTVWNVGILNRSIIIITYIFSLFIISVFLERFFCRFLCPLGASLSMLSLFSLLHIGRRKTCLKCKICKTNCFAYAIDSYGRIDNFECLSCFECINNMYNKNRCPPLRNFKIWFFNHEKKII